MQCLRLVSLAVALAAGCGPSAAQVRRAQRVGYQIEFARVWNVVREEVHRQFSDFEIDDPIAGTIRTTWRLVERRDQDMVGGRTNIDPNAARTPGGMYMRMMVKVRGGPPWKVSVDGEAAEFKPGFTMLVPVAHGAVDEPQWVKNRIDSVTGNVYRRLKDYAVADAPSSGVKKKVIDNRSWSNVPPAAAQVIGEVQQAARKRDAASIRPFMDAGFVWSEGAGGSADTAQAMWNADPTVLARLAQLLEKGCGMHPGIKVVTCPPDAPPDGSGSGERAGFKEAPGGWRFQFYLPD